jgi:hypothetical protein
MKFLTCATAAVIACSQVIAQTPNRPMDPVPKLVAGSISGAAPADAIILFDGTNLDAWERTADDMPARWVLEDGAMTVARGVGTIKTKRRFGDMQLHVEWRPTAMVEGEGQGRGNSGVFLHSLFELQVLDSWNNPTYINGQAGSVYLQYPPLVNASKPPGQWQSYDIIFTAPVYSGNELHSPARLTVFQNGVLVQNDVEIKGATFTPIPQYAARCEPYSQDARVQDCTGDMPITLQDHGQVVSFRNIWVRQL